MLRYPLQAIAFVALALVTACGGDPDALPAADVGRSATTPNVAASVVTNDRWTWLAVDGAQCRDGSPAGVAVRSRKNSSELLIYLGGGPICVDAQSCASSGAPISAAAKHVPRNDIFADRSENPFADWNQVWVPHCTDDYHVGTARNVIVPGVKGAQQFVGHSNMALFLEQLTALFDDATRVVLSGASSGGQGAIASLPQVRRAFKSRTSMMLFIDSGPPVPSSEAHGILSAMVGLWGADRSMLVECGAACSDPTNFFVEHFSWLVRTYGGEISIALSAYINDPVEINEFGISEDDWVAHLELVRSDILYGNNSSTFYVDSRGHIVSDSMYATRAGALTLADWLRLVVGDKPLHVGPK